MLFSIACNLQGIKPQQVKQRGEQINNVAHKQRYTVESIIRRKKSDRKARIQDVHLT